MKRLFCALFTVVFLVSAPGANAAELEDGARAFIHDLEKEAIASLTEPSKERPARVEAFRTLFNDKFAVQAIGRWVLGRNWRRASETERTEFLDLFEDLMVVMYVDRFENYAGEKLDILKTSPVDENRATVHTEIVRPDGADGKPISVLWRVGRQEDVYKVLDVVVEGASMSITLQQEFASIVKQTGSVAGLIEELRKKTSDLNPS